MMPRNIVVCYIVDKPAVTISVDGGRAPAKMLVIKQEGAVKKQV